MNNEEVTALRTAFEERHPDAATTVTQVPGGVMVRITGPLRTPDLSGPGCVIDTLLCLGSNSPFLACFMAATLR